jgi:hypothetical protein
MRTIVPTVPKIKGHEDQHETGLSGDRMNYLVRTIVAAFVVGACYVSLARAQTQQSVRVPEAQRTLSMIVLSDIAPDGTPIKKPYPVFEKAICAAIPRIPVSGWVGKVMLLNDYDKGIGEQDFIEGTRLKLDVATSDLSALSRALVLVNFYAEQISPSTTQPHPETIIPVGSLLQKTVLGLNEGDTVVFSGSFVPFKSARACYDAVDASDYVSMFHFSSIRKRG